jgi:hypothetical protein
VAAAQRLALLSKAAALELAVKYQLASEQTSLVLVVEREGTHVGDLPATVAVPQMLAAGWGGATNLRLGVPGQSARVSDRAFFSLDALVGKAHPRPAASMSEKAKTWNANPSKHDLQNLLSTLEKAYEGGTPLPVSLVEPAANYPVPEVLREVLERVINECTGYTEAECMAAFLALLAIRLRQTAATKFTQHLISQFTFDRKTRGLRRRLIQEVLS